MMRSHMQEVGPVTFPEMLGEKVYMRKFHTGDALPVELSRWQATVDQMLDGLNHDGPAFLMIDQDYVFKGSPHRRPGVHVDGNWLEHLGRHGGHGGHRHNGTKMPRGRHSEGGGHGRPQDMLGNYAPEALILASDVIGCRAYLGEYDGTPGEGGDCAHVNLAGLTPVTLDAGRAYIGQVNLLHESVPIPHHTFRTLVRINVPGWEGHLH